MSDSTISIIIKYCQSWGYKNAFVKTANYLHSYFPEAQIQGDIYPPPAMNQLIAQIASYIFFAGLIFIFFGETIANNVTQLRELCNWVAQNKMQTFIMLYVINLVGSNLLSTGAFEVYVQDELIWSKLEHGTLPNNQFLLQEITKMSPT